MTRLRASRFRLRQGSGGRVGGRGCGATLSASLVRFERGQTTTEYVMIAGLVLAIMLSTLAVMYPGAQDILRRVAECVISDVCDGNSRFGW
jgi:hypothetical protein